MFRRLHNRIRLILAGLVLAVAAPVLAQEQDVDRPSLALMGTIPIYWGEADGLGELLDSSGQVHWARAQIEDTYRIEPLDYLSAEALAPFRYLLLAQPRALSPEENVALDDWVRAGGSVLLFADPMMTGESRFALGDRRRPQDVALLSPILQRWGLELEFDESQQAGMTWADFSGQPIPVNLPGRLRHLPEVDCHGHDWSGLAALCRVGAGHALIVADAAILDFAGPHMHARAGLRIILERIFAQNGENTGQLAESVAKIAEIDGISGDSTPSSILPLARGSP
ncbi:hypothetical protein GCM10009127_28380 [Alteraurantiacibacter aestuarii]|uniref:ABC transporter n=1 Tax=Alteraurantiacibacter aestuarii TaxID=650004 RepID=A0A844ZMF1_9SPHN|nr:Gldg family protein [Alteraurantiacibacter aestuarii]MXO88948.1 ABC transporter [Alteraurantiacibacter aestuarii]